MNALISYNQQYLMSTHFYQSKEGKLLKKSISYIIDDSKHAIYLSLFYASWLLTLGLHFNKHWVWFEGASLKLKMTQSFCFTT